MPPTDPGDIRTGAVRLAGQALEGAALIVGGTGQGKSNALWLLTALAAHLAPVDGQQVVR
ncbi:hypothetical protein [Candidatus Frankia alpina]|uniref:hypothetical protein n=1 Tax=Candidatus Frankia alpina TaxID=2699483 RepID=UPI0013D11610|nr:hypothetical protein [Candidatus Frankia alpina]